MRKIGWMLCTLVVTPSVAFAGSITMTQIGLGKGTNVTIQARSSSSSSWTIESGFAGEIKWSSSALQQDPFFTYCVDLLNNVQSPQTATVRSTSAMDTALHPQIGQMVAWLYNTFAPTATTNAKAAGLQLAIWEVMLDGLQANYTNFNTGGNFRVTAYGGSNSTFTSALSIARLDLLQLGGSDYSKASALWLDVPARHGQDQIFRKVPEPGTWLLAALGFGAIGIARRRRAAV